MLEVEEKQPAGQGLFFSSTEPHFFCGDKFSIGKRKRFGKKILRLKGTFVDFLIKHKYVYRDKKGKLTPYAQHADSGLFVVKECFNEKTQWGGTQTQRAAKALDC